MSHYKVLLIDYEPRSVEQLRAALERAGYTVEVATDGHAGIAAFHRLLPALTLVEAMIPKKHGFEVCHELKRTPHGQQTPIVVITSVYKGRRYRHQAVHQYGADEFLEKPIDPDRLVALVRELIEASPASRVAGGASESTHEAIHDLGDDGGTDAGAPAAVPRSATESEIDERLDDILPLGSAPADFAGPGAVAPGRVTPESAPRATPVSPPETQPKQSRPPPPRRVAPKPAAPKGAPATRGREGLGNREGSGRAPVTPPKLRPAAQRPAPRDPAPAARPSRAMWIVLALVLIAAGLFALWLVVG